jgi:hypothetical protein
MLWGMVNQDRICPSTWERYLWPLEWSDQEMHGRAGLRVNPPFDDPNHSVEKEISA